MYTNKNLSKTTNKLTRKITSIFVLISSLVLLAITQASAVVDISGGLEQTADKVAKEVKEVAAILFGLGAVICLVIACWKLVTGLIQNNRQGTDINWMPIVTCFIATIVCSLFSASTFFGWFGV